MKVAVITNREAQQGRSAFIVTLASIFSRTQHRKVSVYSTGTLDTFLKMVEVKSVTGGANSASVFKAQLNSKAIRGDMLYDYALRIGSEEVYAFAIFDESQDDSKKQIGIFKEIMAIDTADLSLIEVVGDLQSALNQKVIRNADAIINIFNQNICSIEGVKEYIANYNPDDVRRTGYVCMKYDANVIGDKKLAKMVGISERSLMQIPYSSVIAKAALAGELDRIAGLLSNAHPEVLPVRSKVLEVMQYLFDYKGHKYIREVRDWYK